MNIKAITTTAYAAVVTSSAFAGDPAPMEIGKTVIEPAAAGFDAARRPMTNPTLFDLAVPTTNVHAIYMHHRLPSSINTAAGNLDLDGSVDVYALQFEYAFNERLSLVATKDGYVDFKPKALLAKETGFANLAAGLKYAFILDPVAQKALSGTAVIELPTGQTKVFQGTGNGALNLNVAGLQLKDAWQFAGSLGVHLPFDNKEEALTGFVSAHAGYNITDKLYALAEINWFTVLSKGNGTAKFSDSQGGTLVPSAVNFEGGDLFNFGAVNANQNRDIVTAALGVRYKLTDSADLGLAYELPLTDEKNNMMKDRLTVDLVYKF